MLDKMSCCDLFTHFLGGKYWVFLGCFPSTCFKLDLVPAADVSQSEECIGNTFFFFKLTCPINTNSGLSSSGPPVIVFLVIEAQTGRQNLAKSSVQSCSLSTAVQKCLLVSPQQVWSEISTSVYTA